MGLLSGFKTREPRHYNMRPRFSDERQERREYLEQRKRAILYESGQLQDSDMTAEELIRGKFVESTTHLRRRRDKDSDDRNAKTKRFVRLGVSLILLVVLFVYLFRSVYLGN